MNGKSHRYFIIRFCAMTVLLAPALMAQQVNPDAGFIAPRPSRPKVETTPIEKPSTFDISGIVAQAFKMRKPLQMINPLAPARYGDGRESVSWDPDKPEKPKGIILFGIQW